MHVAYQEIIIFLISNSEFFQKNIPYLFHYKHQKYLILVYFLDNTSADC